ncbi:MAG: TolC family protein [Kofleriaceae bacterium]|nr:TolC family protein [Kofleriaceae bacterium]
MSQAWPGRGGPLIALLVVALTGAPAALAAPAPTLPALLEAARRRSPVAREQQAVVAQARAETSVARAELWPRLAASASYARNQFATAVTIPDGSGGSLSATIVPIDQVDAALELTVPVLDLGARRRVGAARARAEQAGASADDRGRVLAEQVVQAYYRWVGGHALRAAATSARAAASAQLEVATARAGAGLAVELEVARARAEVARADKLDADAGLLIVVSASDLTRATGLEVGPAAPAPKLAVPDAAEAPLAAWLPGAERSADVAVAVGATRVAAAEVAAARAAWWPQLAVFASERLSNADGFSGRAASWAAGVRLGWRLDRGLLARQDLADASARTAGARLEVARAAGRDRVRERWHQVEARRVALRAARALVDAARAERGVAQTRFADGVELQLRVIEAEGRLVDAEVAEIQARAELALARALLRVAAGREVEP